MKKIFFIRETSGYGSLYLAKQCNRFILFFVGTGCSLYNPFPTWQRIIEKAVKITYQFSNKIHSRVSSRVLNLAGVIGDYKT